MPAQGAFSLLACLKAASAASFCSSPGWREVWADEFDGHEVDTASWSKDVGPPGDSMTRTAAAKAENVYVENGSLVIVSNGTMQHGNWTNLTSGAVLSRDKRFFGQKPTRVCVRAKLPGGGGDGKGAGLWPAHWLMPQYSSQPDHCYNEIDIMEMVDGAATAYGTYWWGDGDCKKANQKKSGDAEVPDFGDAFHEYSVEFDGKSHVTFAVDGKPFSTVAKNTQADQPPHGTGKFYDYNWYIILNSAVGGDWPGNVTPTTKFPTYHLIDYVRVMQQDQENVVV